MLKRLLFLICLMMLFSGFEQPSPLDYTLEISDTQVDKLEAYNDSMASLYESIADYGIYFISYQYNVITCGDGRGNDFHVDFSEEVQLIIRTILEIADDRLGKSVSIKHSSLDNAYVLSFSWAVEVVPDSWMQYALVYVSNVEYAEDLLELVSLGHRDIKTLSDHWYTYVIGLV